MKENTSVCIHSSSIRDRTTSIQEWNSGTITQNKTLACACAYVLYTGICVWVCIYVYVQAGTDDHGWGFDRSVRACQYSWSYTLSASIRVHKCAHAYMHARLNWTDASLHSCIAITTCNKKIAMEWEHTSDHIRTGSFSPYPSCARQQPNPHAGASIILFVRCTRTYSARSSMFCDSLSFTPWNVVVW